MRINFPSQHLETLAVTSRDEQVTIIVHRAIVITDRKPLCERSAMRFSLDIWGTYSTSPSCAIVISFIAMRPLTLYDPFFFSIQPLKSSLYTLQAIDKQDKDRYAASSTSASPIICKSSMMCPTWCTSLLKTEVSLVERTAGGESGAEGWGGCCCGADMVAAKDICGAFRWACFSVVTA